MQFGVPPSDKDDVKGVQDEEGMIASACIDKNTRLCAGHSCLA